MQEEEKEYKDIDLSASKPTPEPQNQIAETKPDADYSSDATGLPGLVIKYSGGLIKTPKQANYLLLIFVVALLALSAYITYATMRVPQSSSQEIPKEIQDRIQRLGQ